jgi:uncharacterized RDD family membrane protein YckC
MLVDLAVVLPAMIVAVLPLRLLLDGLTGGSPATLTGLLAETLVLAVYGGLLMQRSGMHNGQTLGMQLLGIRVIRSNGERVSLCFGALREGIVIGGLGGVILVLPIIGPLVLVANYLWPLIDERRRAGHDRLVSSLVVRSL